MIKEYETRECKIIKYNKNQKLHFYKNFIEISNLGTVNLLFASNYCEDIFEKKNH